MYKNFLYLASKSRSRQILLELAEIPYKTLDQDFDESCVDQMGSLHEHVLYLARQKMAHVKLPSIIEAKNEIIFVLTADTLVQAKVTGEIFGKPKDRDDAKRMLRIESQSPVAVVTGAVLEKKQFLNNAWQTIQKKEWVSSADVEFSVEEELLDTYLDKLPIAFHSAGAGVIEGYGHNFLKKIDGSYSAVLGLPIFELRQYLKEISF